MNILKNDPFTKTVFTDILPSDRLPREIRKGPRGYILNTDASDMPGSHWVAIYITEDGKGEFWDSYGQAPGFYNQNFTFLDKHCGTFTWNKIILQVPSSDVCGQYTFFFALHRCRRIPMSTIANMFTDSKEWNNELVRDFIDKWYKH
jgi:hypothetical protein